MCSSQETKPSGGLNPLRTVHVFVHTVCMLGSYVLCVLCAVYMCTHVYWYLVEWGTVCTHDCVCYCARTHNIQEAVLSDVPVMMTMKEEIPSGKLFAAFKNGTIEVVDEISAEASRFLTVDSRVSGHVGTYV